MILLDIKEYVQSHGQASLKDIAAGFDLTEETAKEMLAHWERKGKIERVGNTCPCSSCKECSAPCGAVYRWKENQ